MANKPNITPVVHVTKPTDQVPGKDIYTDKRDTPINNLTKKMGQIGTDLVKSFSGTFSDKNLLSLVKEYHSAVNDPINAETRLKQLKGNSRNMLKELGSDVASNILNGLGILNQPKELMDGIFGVPGSPSVAEALANRAPQLRAFMGNDVTRLVSGDYKSAQDLSTLISSVTGNKDIIKFFDMDATFGVVDSIVKTARELNLPELYDTIDSIVDSDMDKKTILLRGLTAAANTCDLTYIKKTINSVGAERISVTEPTLASDCFSGYRKIDKETASADAIEELIDTINQVNPDWKTTQRSGQPISDITVYANASVDAVKALARIPEHAAAASVAMVPQYQLNDPVEIFKQNYPNSVLSEPEYVYSVKDVMTGEVFSYTKEGLVAYGGVEGVNQQLRRYGHTIMQIAPPTSQPKPVSTVKKLPTNTTAQNKTKLNTLPVKDEAWFAVDLVTGERHSFTEEGLKAYGGISAVQQMLLAQGAQIIVIE